MLELLKNYFVFMLILMVFSYLVPKKEYKVYIDFFVAVFVVVLFLRPVLEILTADDPEFVSDVFQEINKEIEVYDYNLEEETIFEYFFPEGEGE